MSLATLLGALLVCVHSAAGECSIKQSGVSCTFWGEQNAYGNERWQHLVATKKLRANMQVLKVSDFEKIPNIRNLTIDGFLNQIEAGAFRTLNHLESVSLRNNDFEELQGNMFTDMKAQNLDIFRCKVYKINGDTFRSASILKRLSIQQNHLGTIRVGVFNDLNLRELYLSENQVSMIEDGAFANMNSLRLLHLDGNFLNNFEAETVLGRNPTLNSLSLEKNRLNRITKASLRGLPNLKTINCKHNEIESIEESSFAVVLNIESILLEGNKLEDFRPSFLPPRVRSKVIELDLAMNKLTYISDQMFNCVPHLKKLCFVGNPLTCACYRKLGRTTETLNLECQKDKDTYFDGSRPVCIQPDTGHSVCLQYHDSDIRDLVQFYVNELEQYFEEEYL